MAIQETSNKTTQYSSSYTEVLTLLDQLAEGKESFNDFLNELARKSVNFGDFTEKIGLWIRVKPGREKQYFERIMKRCTEIEGKITWKELGYGLLYSDSSDKEYVSKRIRTATKQAGFPTTILDAIKYIAKYKEFNFEKNDPSIIIPYFDSSELPVPRDGRTTRYEKIKDSIPEEEKKIISELDKIAAQKRSFNDFLLEIADTSCSLEDIIDKLSIWFRFSKEDKSYFMRLIYKAIETGGKVTWNDLKDNESPTFTSDKQKLVVKINKKAKQIKFQMTILLDVVNGFSRCIDQIEKILESNNLMNILRQRYYKLYEKKETSNQVGTTERTSQKSESNCSQNLLNAIKGIVDGSTGLGEIANIIDHEVNERVGKRTQNCRLAAAIITIDQERTLVLTQIADIIRKRPDTYKIKQPLRVIKLLRIIGLPEFEATVTVMENLIEGKQLKQAQETNKILFVESQMERYRRWESAIQNAELSEFVLEGITGERTIEEDKKYFEEIQARMHKSKDELRKIRLGKSFSGKEITLADIWEDPDQRDVT